MKYMFVISPVVLDFASWSCFVIGAQEKQKQNSKSNLFTYFENRLKIYLIDKM